MCVHARPFTGSRWSCTWANKFQHVSCVWSNTPMYMYVQNLSSSLPLPPTHTNITCKNWWHFGTKTVRHVHVICHIFRLSRHKIELGLLSKVSLGCWVERDHLNVRVLRSHVIENFVKRLKGGTLLVDVLLIYLNMDSETHHGHTCDLSCDFNLFLYW